jgi:hypothetical protein
MTVIELDNSALRSSEQLKELFSEYAILSGGGANEADIAPAP